MTSPGSIVPDVVFDHNELRVACVFYASLCSFGTTSNSRAEYSQGVRRQMTCR